jgi:hypothetical protein
MKRECTIRLARLTLFRPESIEEIIRTGSEFVRSKSWPDFAL